MKDNIIITVIVAIMVFIILACQNYSVNIRAGEDKSESTPANFQHNNIIYPGENQTLNPSDSNTNSYISTTVSNTTAPVFSETSVTTVTDIYTNEVQSEIQTSRKSILESQNDTTVSTQKFNIIQNPIDNSSVGEQ